MVKINRRSKKYVRSDLRDLYSRPVTTILGVIQEFGRWNFSEFTHTYALVGLQVIKSNFQSLRTSNNTII